jgi:hypothetical protein
MAPNQLQKVVQEQYLCEGIVNAKPSWQRDLLNAGSKYIKFIDIDVDARVL